MAEAILTRGGGINQDILNRLDTIELKDPAYATILVTVQDPEGSPVENTKIKFIPIDGTAVDYTTNEKGQALYKTAVSQININDSGFPGYFDQNPFIDKTVDTVVGTVYKVNVQRSKKFTNGQNIKITSGSWANFSNLAKTCDVNLSGGGGSPALSKVNYGFQVRITRTKSTSSSYLYNYTYQVAHTGINGFAPSSGGDGYTNRINNINLSGQNYKYTIGKSLNKSDRYTQNNYGSYMSSYSAVEVSHDYSSGYSGGTTSFGNIVSAVGGAGGSTTNGLGGNGASGGVCSKPIYILEADITIAVWTKGTTTLYSNGGKSSFMKNNISSSQWNDYNYCDFNLVSTMYSGNGQNGWIWLNNFQYR